MKQLRLTILGLCWLLTWTMPRVTGVSYGSSQRSEGRSAQTQDVSAWKTLKNRAGWSIKYPPSWVVWSCMNCPDPTAPEVYVSFGQPTTMNGFVMVSPLWDKPAGKSVAEWLSESKRSANQNPIVSEEPVSLNGLTGLRVRYKNPAMDEEMEAIYVVKGSNMFEISFDGQRRGTRLEDLPNYSVYRRMTLTFEVGKP